MKLIKLALIAAVALAGSAFFQSANATVPTPADGDLFMGFHSSTAANEYLWDIGQFSLFDNKPVGFHLSLGNIGADLSSASLFGAAWATDQNLLWGAAGALDPTGTSATLFATVSTSVPGQGTPWGRKSPSAQVGTESTLQTMEFTDYFGQNGTLNNPNATIHDKSGNSWASYNGGANSPGASFNTWVPTIEAGGTGGLVTTKLDLFRIDPSTSGGLGQYIGTFSIDAAGNVNYDVFSPVPEPSTYASLIGGSAILFALLRFRSRSLKA